jgi:hypothetical protein
MKLIVGIVLLSLAGIVATAQAFSPVPRDQAIRTCSNTSLERWSYHGTQYDKEQQRSFVYKSCMADMGQEP